MRLAEIVARLGGELLGDADVTVGKVATLASADAASITFVANPKYRSQLQGTRAGAVIVAPSDRNSTALPRIVAANPYAYFARVSQLLHAATPPAAGIDPSAKLAPTAMVAPSAHIGAHVSVGEGAQIGARAVIEHGCSVGAGTHIGADSRLYPNVVVYHDCVIGARCVLHAGVVIGADGFGWAREDGRWIKVPQIGRVLVADDVEIGANTTIDRGTLDDTVIETGVKLDNQIQIGHNVRVGAHSAIAACVGIAGSASIGKHCSIGGAAGILGHLQICDQVTIAAFSLVTKSITEPGVYGGTVPLQPQRAWLANAARYKQLEAQAEELRQLRRELEQYLQRIAALEQKTP